MFHKSIRRIIASPIKAQEALMPSKTKSGESQDPPVDPAQTEPVAQHIHDETKHPLKAPIGGVPPNIAKQFPGKGAKHGGGFNQGAKSRNFRHQGR
jgi:hypothetical protein